MATVETSGLPCWPAMHRSLGCFCPSSSTPGTRHVLDAPQLGLLERLRARLGDAWSWEIEVPMAAGRDLRAVDARLRRGDCTIAVEAITRLADVQAQMRAAQLKRRDIDATRLLLLVGATRANRRALAAAEPILGAAFLTGTWRLLRQLSAGEDPARDLILVMWARCSTPSI